MKSKLFFAVAALCCVSCESFLETELAPADGSTEVFSATVEVAPITRTTLSGYLNSDGSHSLYWVAGDQISISDGTETALFTTEDDYSTTAEFVCTSGKISNTAGDYVAFYPSFLNSTNMVLPADQNYVDSNVENFPIMAVSTDKNLAFKNLCGIVRFSLKSEVTGQIQVSSISLSADMGMSGPFTVGADGAAMVKGTDGVVLNCDEPVSLYTTSATDFNLIVPQGDYMPLRVKICDSEGKEVNLVSEGTISVRRSEITCISLTLAKSTFDTSLETIPIRNADVDFSER